MGPRAGRSRLVLALDLTIPVVDGGAGGLIGRLAAARRPDLRQFVEVVDRAASDPRVRALIARVDHPADSWAHAEELRDAVERFGRTGKPTLAHARSFGEPGNGSLAYYVATAFDEIVLQPSGEVRVPGTSAEVRFFADLLEKVDVDAELDRRHEYKSAADLFTRRRFTEAHHRAVDRIVASHHERLVAAVVSGRGLTTEDATALVDEGQVSAEEAERRGMVDRLAYPDQAAAHAKAAVGKEARLVSGRTYGRTARLRRLLRRRATVALIHGAGAITVGRSRAGLMGRTMGADTIVAGFSQAVRDRRVRAIVFRVDSPGGSAVGSDAIWRAVVRAREAGKPVVVSMGAVAGSGGYWVSMAADEIVAAPGTLTGSIGVVGGKFVTRRLLERLGITTDEAHRGANALMYSSSAPFTEDQRRRNARMLDRIYDEFVTKAAEGRGLPRDDVEAAARGRVWTGADAAARGLVDRLGGYHEALESARRLAGLAPDAPLRLRTLPRQSVAERLGVGRGDLDDLVRVADATGSALRAAGLVNDGTASMPVWERRLAEPARHVRDV